MWHYAAVLSTRRLFLCLPWTDYTDLASLFYSVPTQDQVLVPETLLKKRKSQEAARAARRADAEKTKQVS